MTPADEHRLTIRKIEERVDRRRQKNRRDEGLLSTLRTELEEMTYPAEPSARAISFVKTFRGNPTQYRYVAHKDDHRGLWWASGATGPNGVTWRQLVDFMRSNNTSPGIYTTLERGIVRSYMAG